MSSSAENSSFKEGFHSQPHFPGPQLIKTKLEKIMFSPKMRYGRALGTRQGCGGSVLAWLISLQRRRLGTCKSLCVLLMSELKWLVAVREGFQKEAGLEPRLVCRGGLEKKTFQASLRNNEEANWNEVTI